MRERGSLIYSCTLEVNHTGISGELAIKPCMGIELRRSKSGELYLTVYDQQSTHIEHGRVIEVETSSELCTLLGDQIDITIRQVNNLIESLKEVSRCLSAEKGKLLAKEGRRGSLLEESYQSEPEPV